MSKQATIFQDTNRAAIFGNNREYRYVLTRDWRNDRDPMVMFIGLNPSTASESKDDNTIKKLIKIARNNGYGGLYMLNLFALVSTDPKALLTHPDPVAKNDYFLREYSLQSSRIVFCWGAFKQAKERAEVVKKMFPESSCLDVNDDGSPKHPLYCLDKQKIVDYLSPQTV